jgi:cytochrome c553
VSAAICLAASPSIGQAPAEMDAPTLYLRACAACHGADGSGLDPDSPIYQSFAAKPAAFTDPLFNSREPAADWFLVTKHGGKRLGLSDQMPGYGAALSDEQIENVVAYLKSLNPSDRYPPGDLNLTRPIATTKAFPEDEALIINRYEVREADDDPFLTTLYYARRFGPRGHGEVKLTHEKKGSESFLEELELEYKRVVGYSLEREVLHSIGAEIAIPIEDDDASEVLIPYYTMARVLSPRTTFQGQIRAKLPVDDFDRGSAEVRGIVHWLPSPWPRSVAPGLELTLEEPFDGGPTTATAIPQLFAGLSKGGHVAFAFGVEVPLDDNQIWDYRLRSFLLWDIADGPFWRGW